MAEDRAELQSELLEEFKAGREGRQWALQVAGWWVDRGMAGAAVRGSHCGLQRCGCGRVGGAGSSTLWSRPSAGPQGPPVALLPSLAGSLCLEQPPLLRSPLLACCCAHPALQDLKGHLYPFCRDQHGSRLVQQQLEGADPEAVAGEGGVLVCFGWRGE